MSGRKFLPLLLISLIALSFAGVQAQDGQTTITWLTLSDFGGDPEGVAAQFEEANPDINVELERVPFNALFEQIQVRLSSQSPDPDVISVDVPLVTGYAVRNWLLPLDDAFTEEQFADWLPAAVEAGSFNGQLMAAPVSMPTAVPYSGLAVPSMMPLMVWNWRRTSTTTAPAARPTASIAMAPNR